MAENENVNVEPIIGLADHYPIVLNGVEYQYFKTWNIVRNDTITTHETESGLQEDVVSRRGRLSITGTVTCFQPLVAQLVGLANLDEFEAKYYDPAIDDYATINCRIGAGSMSYSLKEKSAKLKTVNGVWTVTFTLEEF